MQNQFDLFMVTIAGFAPRLMTRSCFENCYLNNKLNSKSVESYFQYTCAI